MDKKAEIIGIGVSKSALVFSAHPKDIIVLQKTKKLLTNLKSIIEIATKTAKLLLIYTNAFKNFIYGLVYVFNYKNVLK